MGGRGCSDPHPLSVGGENMYFFFWDKSMPNGPKNTCGKNAVRGGTLHSRTWTHGLRSSEACGEGARKILSCTVLKTLQLFLG